MAGTPLLALRQLVKSFGGARALRGVDLDLHAGEVHALLGENGAGKSTLIKIVTGAHRPDSGTITVLGTKHEGLSPATAHRLGIACIYQQPALFPDLTIAENIALRLESVRAFRRIDWMRRQTHATELLQRVGANLSPAREIRSLSMPEQQLVEIACALGAGARIVIMDEPTASLTQKEQYLLFAVVRELRRAGVGVIYISHRLEEIFALADRVTVLRDGESVGTCRVGEISESTLIRMMVGREMNQIYPPRAASIQAPALAVRDIECRATGVSGVTFEVRCGEVFGLAGLVGAGRTELARILFGITPADSGEIQLFGQTISVRTPQDAVRHGIAYVPEDRRRHGVILEMPVEENVTMAVHPTLFPQGWLRFQAERDLARNFIHDLAVKCTGPDAPAASLSGGNQQKVSLARWLATRPKVLILDEPTQGVDVGAKSEIHKIVRQLAQEGLAVLLISSDLPEVIGMSDRIGVMRGGNLTAVLEGGAEADAVMGAAMGR